MASKLVLKKEEPLESEIQAEICKYLTDKGYFFWRTNNAPIWQSNGKGGGFFRAMSKWSMKGVSDLILVKDGGVALFLEVKRPSGVMSKDQVIFAKKCMVRNAEYHIVKSVEDVEKLGL